MKPEQLQALLPRVVRWAEELEREAAPRGRPLTEREDSVALRAGVHHRERVRILEVQRMPEPEDEDLMTMAREFGLYDLAMSGLTIGHCIFIITGQLTTGLLGHELRHVYQVEQEGSLAKFLDTYMQQIATAGYKDSPFEEDARTFARSLPANL